jgi:hypothetical protein
MKEELQLELVKKYPKILKDFRGDPRQTCLAFGIETGSGWYELLDKCMNKLQYFCDLCSKEGREVQVVANQVKEKYGSLRFYVSVHGANEIESDILHNIIDHTEMMSSQICEESGEHGVPCVKWGWYKTLCYEEARKQGYKACDEGTESYWKEKDEGKHKD